ncbi:MAG TPA: protein-glutamate O-methyltransferase CheR [Terriglobales bacterium]|nr:protein-glutamate O-methyltransferase CheR [Terriglobales bacterium]
MRKDNKLSSRGLALVQAGSVKLVATPAALSSTRRHAVSGGTSQERQFDQNLDSMATDLNLDRPGGGHKLSPSPVVLEHELSELRLLLESQAGVLLNAPTEFLMAGLSRYMESRRLASIPDLLGRVQTSDAECEALLEHLLEGETAFFRHPAAFAAFENHILPELHMRKAGDSSASLRLWSAGCSTGEEAYSIAMSVCERVNSNGDRWSIHILASDIRQAALAMAERGLYPELALAGVPRRLVQWYFARVGHHVLVKPRLRNLVTFTQCNLRRAIHLGRFDCIFCMDVLPHFSAAQRLALVQRLHLYLEPGGYLLLGQGEKLPAIDVNFQPQACDQYTLYRKTLAAAARVGKSF